MSTAHKYLKPNVAAEPLYNQWYAWWYLIPPQTAPLFVVQLHERIMQSFVSAPDIHVAALKNPALMGGPYINYPADRAGEVKQLLERTRREQASARDFVDALAALDKLLGAANGYSLEDLYPKVPDVLQGYVELTYDLNQRASARFIEPLLYASPHYRESSQSLLIKRIERDVRPYAFSTPRLSTDDGVEVHKPFRHEGVDLLFRMRNQAGSVDEVRELLGVADRDATLFSTFFTEEAPRKEPRYTGKGVRVRYFGHACVLLETRDVSILLDPVVSYDFPNDLPRFTHADLPETIDYVLITHGHADHLMLETLLPLRTRIGTVVVPRNNGGYLADPSLKMLLRQIGFPRVLELEDLDALDLPGGQLVGIPFLGEHCDLSIRAKTAHLVKLGGHSILMAADSNAIEPRLYDHVSKLVGGIDVLFLGMESEGAPMSWMYGPLLHNPLPRRMDQSRRMNGSNAERAIEIVRRIKPQQVYVYAMAREPWLSHVMIMGYHEDSPQLIEARKLMDYCRAHGLQTDMPFVRSELFLGT